MEHTIIGDTVNLAARIKSLSSREKALILISAATWEGLGGKFSAEKQFQAEIKGKSDVITVYQLSSE